MTLLILLNTINKNFDNKIISLHFTSDHILRKNFNTINVVDRVVYRILITKCEPDHKPQL